MRRTRHLCAASAAICLSGAVAAQNGTPPQPASSPPAQPAPEATHRTQLGVGDPAPALDVQWVKGSPVTGFERGRTYVIEFWATWCGPCMKSIPHLTQLQRQHMDVTFIGVSVWEANQSKVAPLVTEKGDRMGYTVAMDNVPPLPEGTEAGGGEAQRFAIENGSMSRRWLTAAGRHGIPTAFVVDGDGRIAYIGHPMWLDSVLQQMAKGAWTAAEGMEGIKSAERLAADMRAEAESAPAKALADLGALSRDHPGAASMFATIKYRLLVQTDDPRATVFAQQLIEAAVANQDAATLEELAWTIADPDSTLKRKDSEIAVVAASRAAELTHNTDPSVLDTLAWAHVLRKDVDTAIELERKAIELATGGLKEHLEESLKRLESAQTGAR